MAIKFCSGEVFFSLGGRTTITVTVFLCVYHDHSCSIEVETFFFIFFFSRTSHGIFFRGVRRRTRLKPATYDLEPLWRSPLPVCTPSTLFKTYFSFFTCYVQVPPTRKTRAPTPRRREAKRLRHLPPVLCYRVFACSLCTVYYYNTHTHTHAA